MLYYPYSQNEVVQIVEIVVELSDLVDVGVDRRRNSMPSLGKYRKLKQILSRKEHENGSVFFATCNFLTEVNTCLVILLSCLARQSLDLCRQMCDTDNFRLRLISDQVC